MSDVDFSKKEQLLAAQEGIRRGLFADSHVDMQKEQERRERLYGTPDDEFYRLIGRTSSAHLDASLEVITE